MKPRFQRLPAAMSAIHGSQGASPGQGALTGNISTLLRASRSARSRSSLRQPALLLT